jgi:hypothetical protein
MKLLGHQVQIERLVDLLEEDPLATIAPPST